MQQNTLLVSGFSPPASQKNGRSDRKRNFGWVNFIKSEYRSTAKKRNGFLFFKKQLDRIVRIEQPSAEGPLAVGEKNPFNPVNPV